MNKFTAILILSVLAVSFAADENCKDHPWAKRNILDKFAKLVNAAEDADFKAVRAIFNDQSTATASTAITEADQPAVFAAWKDDAKTCCTKAIYDQIVKLPVLLDKFVGENESDFVRTIAGLAKGIKKCGAKKGKKGTDGEEHSVEQLSPLDLLKHTKVPSATPGDQAVDTIDTPVYGTDDAAAASGTTTAAVSGSGSVRRFLQTTAGTTTTTTTTAPAEKFGIEYLVDYYKAKAAIVKTWVQFQRGNLVFLCRLPSKAKDSLTSDQLKVDKTSYENVQKAYKDALLQIRTALGGLANVIKFVFKAFGDGPKCKNAAEKTLKILARVAICKKDDCKRFFEQIKPRPLDLALLKPLIGSKGQNPDFEGGNDEFRKKPTRFLQDTQEPEPTAVTDANATKSVSAPGDDALTGGTPYTADGKCATGQNCGDFTPASTQYNEEGAITKDGKLIETSGNSVIVSAFAVVLGLVALLF